MSPTIKYNGFGEVMSVNGITTGHHLGTPMQDAIGTPEENSAYGTEIATVTRCENVIEDKQPELSGSGPSGKVLEITTADELDTILANATADDVGRGFLYLGETTETYKYECVYIIREG